MSTSPRQGGRRERRPPVGEAESGLEALLRAQGVANQLLQASEEGVVELLRPVPLQVGAQALLQLLPGAGAPLGAPQPLLQQFHWPGEITV